MRMRPVTSPLSTVEGRYQNDSVFHAMVDGMIFAIEGLQLSPAEVREAAMYAALRVEERRPSPCPHNAVIDTSPPRCAKCGADPTEDDGLGTVNDLLHLDGAITTKGDELKMWIRDLDNGGTHKAYLDTNECRRLAVAFTALATRLERKV